MTVVTEWLNVEHDGDSDKCKKALIKKGQLGKNEFLQFLNVP
jgi:hypothetical protein